MNFSSVLACPFFRRDVTPWIVAFFVAVCCLITASAEGQIEGFTEPFRQIELSTQESGPIQAMAVEEGQFIEANGIICELDRSLQEIQLELAKQRSKSTGQVWTAEQGMNQRQVITDRIRRLQQTGSATESELLRSNMELSIAKGKLLVAKEEAAVRAIEYRQAMLRLDRRTVRAPFGGVVSKMHRREGEFVSTLRPEIATLIQVDKLIAKFNVPSSQAENFELGSVFELTLSNGETVSAEVYRVAVHTDAQSGTVEIKLLIDNADLNIRAGEMLLLQI